MSGGWLGQTMGNTYCSVLKYKMMTTDSCQSSFGCHVANSDVATGIPVKEATWNLHSMLGISVVRGQVSLPCSCPVLLIASLSCTVVVVPCH